MNLEYTTIVEALLKRWESPCLAFPPSNVSHCSYCFVPLHGTQGFCCWCRQVGRRAAQPDDTNNKILVQRLRRCDSASPPDEYVVVAWYGLLLSIAVEGRLALSPLTTHLTLQ